MRCGAPIYGQKIPLSDTSVEVRDEFGEVVATVAVIEVLQHPAHLQVVQDAGSDGERLH